MYPPPTPYLHGRTHTAPPACVSTAHSRSTDVSTGGPLYSRVKKLSSSAPAYVFKDITFLTDIIGGARGVRRGCAGGTPRVKSPHLKTSRRQARIYYMVHRHTVPTTARIYYRIYDNPIPTTARIYYMVHTRSAYSHNLCESHGHKKKPPPSHIHTGGRRSCSAPRRSHMACESHGVGALWSHTLSLIYQ